MITSRSTLRRPSRPRRTRDSHDASGLRVTKGTPTHPKPGGPERNATYFSTQNAALSAVASKLPSQQRVGGQAAIGRSDGGSGSRARRGPEARPVSLLAQSLRPVTKQSDLTDPGFRASGFRASARKRVKPAELRSLTQTIRLIAGQTDPTQADLEHASELLDIILAGDLSSSHLHHAARLVESLDLLRCRTHESEDGSEVRSKSARLERKIRSRFFPILLRLARTSAAEQRHESAEQLGRLALSFAGDNQRRLAVARSCLADARVENAARRMDLQALTSLASESSLDMSEATRNRLQVLQEWLRAQPNLMVHRLCAAPADTASSKPRSLDDFVSLGKQLVSPDIQRLIAATGQAWSQYRSHRDSCLATAEREHSAALDTALDSVSMTRANYHSAHGYRRTADPPSGLFLGGAETKLLEATKYLREALARSNALFSKYEGLREELIPALHDLLEGLNERSRISALEAEALGALLFAYDMSPAEKRGTLSWLRKFVRLVGARALRTVASLHKTEPRANADPRSQRLNVGRRPDRRVMYP